MKIRYLAVLVALGLTLFAGQSTIAHAIPPSGTEVYNDISADTTWTLAGSPYYTTSGDFRVLAGATLTIQPGVTVYVGGRAEIYGSLIANGTATQPITFAGPYGWAMQPGTFTWDGITLYGSPAASSITYSVIEGANRALNGPGVPAITDDTFQDNLQAAFTQQGYPVTRSRFIGNVFAVALLNGGSVTDSDFSGNDVALSIWLNNGETAAAHHDNLYDNGIPATHYQVVSNQSCSPVCSVDASDNWWGTDDPAAVWPTIADCHNPNFTRQACVTILPLAPLPFDNGYNIPPAFAPVVSPAPNSHGWNNTNVSLSWSGGGLAPGATTIGCGDASYLTETSGTTATCTEYDATGTLSTASFTIKIDKTSPTVAFSGNQGTYTVDQTVSIRCSASDALSGLDTSATICPAVSSPAYLLPLGSNTVQAVAQDLAGNVAHSSAAFAVKVTFDTLCTLTQRFVSAPALASSLCHELLLAKSAALHGDNTAVAASLALYRQQVDGHVGPAVSAEHARILDRLAAAL